MRIIAGSAKGRTIQAPKGMGTRPTTDRVKESVFSIIQHEIPNARVLDLFAGTGALGLESLSRGAKFAAFCDNDKSSIDTIKTNINSLKMEDQCDVFFGEYEAMINRYYSKEKFDVIFLDPPYAKGMAPGAIELILEKDILSDDGIIACEHDKEYDIKIFRKDLCRVRDKRKFGRTCFTFFEKIVGE